MSIAAIKNASARYHRSNEDTTNMRSTGDLVLPDGVAALFAQSQSSRSFAGRSLAGRRSVVAVTTLV
jgi:hypothetical protein